MTAEKRPLPGTGKVRPFVYKTPTITKHIGTDSKKVLMWVVLFRDEIRYRTADWDSALFYAVSLAYIWADPK